MKDQQGFEISADATTIRVRAWGKTIKDLFRNTLCGMASFVKPDIFSARQKMKKQKHAIAVEAVDLNSLLVEFLSQVIAQSDFQSTLFTNVAFKSLGENFLEGELSGIKTEAFDKEVRAVSYADVDIKKNPESGLYETTLVFEV